jgi:hypothetical protein
MQRKRKTRKIQKRESEKERTIENGGERQER